MKKELNKKKSEKVLSNGNSDKQEFEKYLQKIEDAEYDGQDVSWHLPENATPIEKAKYELCEKMLIYQQDNNLSDEEIANRIKITTGEARDILYCHIDYFTFDRLITYASNLFSNSEIKVILEPKKVNKNQHARAV